MAKVLNFKSRSYKEAVDYFKQKINLPTKKWDDLKGAMHTRAFTVAGAMREDILCDFRNAVDKAISKGESLQQFRDRFYQIAGKWSEADENFKEKMERPKYGAWRSKVIYQTNMNTAAAAAAERQVRDPKLKGVFTHAKYICQMLPGSREEHKQWNGTVLPVNDPWWQKHSPPNGFGCLCEKEFISKYEMDSGMEKETKAPTAPNDTTNIGENWDYSIGEADQGVYWASERVENKLKTEKNKSGWDEVPQNSLWSRTKDPTSQLPEITDKKFEPDASITKSNAKEKLRELLGIKKGETKNVSFNDSRTGFQYNVNVDVDWLVDHIQGKGSLRYQGLSMFVETLRNPAEIRVMFMKSLKTGKSAIRTVFWNHFKFGEKNYLIKIVSDAGQANEFKIWTAIASTKDESMIEGVKIFKAP